MPRLLATVDKLGQTRLSVGVVAQQRKTLLKEMVCLISVALGEEQICKVPKYFGHTSVSFQVLKYIQSFFIPLLSLARHVLYLAAARPRVTVEKWAQVANLHFCAICDKKSKRFSPRPALDRYFFWIYNYIGILIISLGANVLICATAKEGG